jgi:hypothetical protein
LPFLFPVAVFLSAALLFLVEPMFARMLLPKLGGAPAVWNTCIALYQALLLAGYAYAHVLTRRLTLRTQIIVHLALLFAAALVLPVGVDRAWAPAATENPSLAVGRLLLRSLGLPFFVLSGSGPLLQQWFAWRYGAASNPYRLYAASNGGSLLALLAYPVAIEPTLRLREQSLWWTAGYVTLLITVLPCGGAAWNSVAGGFRASPIDSEKDAHDSGAAPLRWLALAFVPSSLMLSVTTFISTDIAAIPLVWVVPLALYLFTLIVAFADRQIVSRRTTDALFAPAVIGIITLILAERIIPVRYAIVAHIIGFLLVALACHMRLAALRPHAARLTEYYLWIAAGGALGGLFNTFAAPVLFVTPIEYPLVVIAACVLFADGLTWRRLTREPRLAYVATVLPALVLIVATQLIFRVDWNLPESTRIRSALAALPALALALVFRKSPLRLAVGLALLLIVAPRVRIDDRVILHTERNFFGVLRVTDTGFEHVLLSGTTIHGSQAVDPALRCEPLSYYTRSGPIGQLFAVFRQGSKQARIGVVGLGTAAVSAYARPGDTWTYFEINPADVRIARTPEYFTYLPDCAPDARVVLGDARLSLERQSDGAFDILIIDAFSSDAIPVHLMTAEAVSLYLRKLNATGLLVLHISNRYLDLAPVVAAIVEVQGLAAAIQDYQPELEETNQLSALPSRWVVVAHHQADLQPLLATGRWPEPVGAAGPRWTDDYSNVLRILKR